MMKLRATWVCLAMLLFTNGSSYTSADDDVEVPGLDAPGGRAAFLIDEMPIAIRGLPPAAEPAPEVEPLPDDAQAILDAHNREAHAIRRKAEQEIAVLRDKAIKSLKELQDKYTRDAKLDEAVAIRNKIRKLKVSHLNALPDPGTMHNYINKINRSFYFTVTGAVEGSVWGTEVYTYDSTLAAAAVHAGVLKPGERGIVRVTMVKSPNTHTGSVANGVRSGPWGVYPASYIVERPEALETTTPSETKTEN